MHVAAYLDPGSGSIIASAAAAGMAGAAVAAKVGWRRMTGRLRGTPQPVESTASEEQR